MGKGEAKGEGAGGGVGEGTGEGKGDAIGLFEGTVDLVNRDPNDINDHLKVAFEDVLAEPDGAHSNDCVWKCAFCCFNCGKRFCYRLMTLCCGWWIALCWGCEFACVTFTHIWEFTPMLRIFAINCGCCQKFWGTALQCFLAPICETFGLCFSRIQVRNQ